MREKFSFYALTFHIHYIIHISIPIRLGKIERALLFLYIYVAFAQHTPTHSHIIRIKVFFVESIRLNGNSCNKLSLSHEIKYNHIKNTDTNLINAHNYKNKEAFYFTAISCLIISRIRLVRHFKDVKLEFECSFLCFNSAIDSYTIHCFKKLNCKYYRIERYTYEIEYQRSSNVVKFARER